MPLPHIDFNKYDVNFGKLHKLSKIHPKDLVIKGDVTIDTIAEALKKFEVSYKMDSKELGKVKVYESNQYKDDKLRKN